MEEFGTFFDGLSTLSNDLYTLYNKSLNNDITPFTLYEVLPSSFIHLSFFQ